MSKYKIGDKVKVITLNQAERIGEHINIIRNKDGDVIEIDRLKMNGSGYFNCMCNEMLDFMGKVVTIKNVYPRGYNIKECGYAWTDEMFTNIDNNPNN